jgi:MFS family permease
VRAWHLFPLAFMLGLTYAFEIPARQSLLGDIAGGDMPNALALNSTVVNGARMVGPAVAGWLVAAVGEGWCFALNAASFLGTIGALLAMRLPPRAGPSPGSERGHLAAGLAYARRTPTVRALLLLLAASSFFAMPYTTLLPALAKDVLRGDARLLGALMASAGGGALAAGVVLMARRGLGGLGRSVGAGATLLGAGLAGAALSRQVGLSCAALAVAGFGYLTQAAGTMTLLQSIAPPEMRGRLMGLFSTLFIGVAPFGALAMGLAAQRTGVPAVLLAGGLAVAAASGLFHLALPRLGADGPEGAALAARGSRP